MEIRLIKVHGTLGMERRTHHIHTQDNGRAPSDRLPPSKWYRASQLGTRCNQRFIHGAIDERQFPENQQASMTFLAATMSVSRDQSRSSDSVGFGNEERAHVENIDAVTLTEKLEETLETSHLLNISGDMTGF